MHPPESASPPNSQKSSKRCSDCLTVVGRGLAHSYTNTTFRENMHQLAHNDQKFGEHIASAVVNAKEASPHGTIRLAQTKGRCPLPLTPGISHTAYFFINDFFLWLVSLLTYVFMNTVLNDYY